MVILDRNTEEEEHHYHHRNNNKRKQLVFTPRLFSVRATTKAKPTSKAKTALAGAVGVTRPTKPKHQSVPFGEPEATTTLTT